MFEVKHFPFIQDATNSEKLCVAGGFEGKSVFRIARRLDGVVITISPFLQVIQCSCSGRRFVVLCYCFSSIYVVWQNFVVFPAASNLIILGEVPMCQCAAD
jgi:hypothetical protein